MKNFSNVPQHPVMFALQNFMRRLTQHPGIYPIRFYKKASRYRRPRHGMIV